jgi:hypothetical protein
MRDTINQSTWYRACDFGEANLARVKFTQCSFDRCRFSGLLHEVLFDGRSFVDTPGTEVFCEVDFSEARFDDVMFMGLNLGDVPMPAEGNVRVLLRARGTIERALEMLKDDPSRNARVLEAVLEDELKAMQGEDYDIIWNSDDFGGLVGEQFNELAERVLGLSKRPGD